MSADVVQVAIHALAEHGRISISGLAQRTGRTVAEVRSELEAFNDVELPGLALEPMFLIEPVRGWPEDDSTPAPADDDLVRFWPTMSGADVGLAHLDAATLGPLLAAADELRCLEPGNQDLASAVTVLRSSLMANVSGRAGYRTRTVAVLRAAAEQHRAVRITYASSWAPRVTTRVIHPYRVVSTVRGFEVDAGPLDTEGRPRTFLLTGIRDVAVLPEQFDVPATVGAALAANRRLTPVRGVAPHSLMWAVRHWAERVELGREDTADVSFTAWVLPPVADRTALMCLVAGPGIDLDDPDLDAAVAQHAAALLDHHGL